MPGESFHLLSHAVPPIHCAQAIGSTYILNTMLASATICGSPQEVVLFPYCNTLQLRLTIPLPVSRQRIMKLDTKSLRAIDICRTDMVTADENSSLYDVSKLMRENHVGDVVITRSGEAGDVPIGILTDRDIVVHGIACDIVLDDVAAGDLSAQDLVTIEPDADIFEITGTMNSRAVRRIIVNGDSGYCGIITFDDILWALSQIVSNLSAVTERQIQREIESAA